MKYDELVKALRHCAKGSCDDCNYLAPCLKKWQENKNRFGASILMIMDDAAAAIEALQAEVAELKQVNMEIFEDLPKWGEWIVTKYYTWECSVCGKNPTTGMGYVQTRKALYNYCPNCGAKMKMEVQE